jgi:hypothetical protein
MAKFLQPGSYYSPIPYYTATSNYAPVNYYYGGSNYYFTGGKIQSFVFLVISGVGNVDLTSPSEVLSKS